MIGQKSISSKKHDFAMNQRFLNKLNDCLL